MRSNASSNGPGIGASPNAASHRNGLGIRLSPAAILTARMVRLRKLRALRTLLSLGRERNGLPRSYKREAAVTGCSQPCMNPEFLRGSKP